MQHPHKILLVILHLMNNVQRVDVWKHAQSNPSIGNLAAFRLSNMINMDGMRSLNPENVSGQDVLCQQHLVAH